MIQPAHEQIIVQDFAPTIRKDEKIFRRIDPYREDTREPVRIDSSIIEPPPPTDDRFRDEIPKINDGEGVKTTATPTDKQPKASGQPQGLPDFELAGFNGYLVLLVIGTIILAVRNQ